MMDGIINFEVFLVAAILLNLTPGTDTMYIVSRSIAQGRAAGIYSALGITGGIMVHTFLAAFGLSLILVQSSLVFNAIKIIGALYLAYLGIQMIRAKQSENEQQTLANASNKKIFLQGLITNVTNPKVALFFLAFLPQFIQTGSDGINPVPFLILGLTFTLTGGTWSMITALFCLNGNSETERKCKSSSCFKQINRNRFYSDGIKATKYESSCTIIH